VLDAELKAGEAKVAGTIARAVVGEQASDGDALLGVEGEGGAQEGDSGLYMDLIYHSVRAGYCKKGSV